MAQTMPEITRTFAQWIKYAREEKELEPREVAKRLQVPLKRFEAMEAGTDIPIGGETPLLQSILPALKAAEAKLALQRARQELSNSGGLPTPGEVAARLASSEEVGTFGSCLMRQRENYGLTRLQLANRVGTVTQRAIRAWELDESIPVADNYTKLLEVFPSLAQAPKPAVQEIDKPVGRSADVQAEEPVPASDSVPTITVPQDEPATEAPPEPRPAKPDALGDRFRQLGARLAHVFDEAEWQLEMPLVQPVGEWLIQVRSAEGGSVVSGIGEVFEEAVENLFEQAESTMSKKLAELEAEQLKLEREIEERAERMRQLKDKRAKLQGGG